MPSTILTPVLTGGDGKPTYNLGMAETYSWIPIQNNQNRQMFARAGYITNLSDLTLNLSASDINIGAVAIADSENHLIRAQVNVDSVHGNSLQVQTQDLESTVDDITIGDKFGNFASVNAATSALQTFVVNPVTAVTVSNPVTSVLVSTNSNTLAVSGSVTLTNPVTAISIPVTPSTLFQFNNFGVNTHRGWTMSDSQIPMLAVRVKPNAGITAKILDYEIGNNNNSSSTIGYVWYENPIISGSYSWVDLNSFLQYAIFTDAYGSNTPNGISGGTTRHSGIIVGKNASSEVEIEDIALSDGGSPNVLTLAVQRLDSATKLDVWFAVTVGI